MARKFLHRIIALPVLVLLSVYLLSAQLSYAQNKQIAQGPIQKLDSPNGMQFVVIPVVRGYLVGVTENSVKLMVDDVEHEIKLGDVRIVYKFYNKNQVNSHKVAVIGAGLAVGASTTFEIVDKDKIDAREFLKNTGIASGAAYGIFYLGSRVYNKLLGEGEIPDKLPLFVKNKENTPSEDLLKKIKQLDKWSYLELVLNQ